MRSLKTLALMTALMVSGGSYAADSIQTDYNNASLSLTAEGNYAQAVSFTIPSTQVTLDSQQIRPGNTFTVSIPVTNTTDRAINVVATAGAPSGAGASHLTVTASNDRDTIEVGGTAILTFTFTFDSSTAAAQAGQTVSVTFDVTATGVYEDSTGTSF